MKDFPQIDVPPRDSGPEHLSKLMEKLPRDVTDEEIVDGFTNDIHLATKDLLGIAVGEELLHIVKHKILGVYKMYVDHFREPLPVDVTGHNLRKFAELMFVSDRNEIKMIHCDEHIVISQWSLGKVIDGEWTRGPHFVGNENLGYYRENHPEHYDKLRNLSVGEIVRLGNSRFERLR